MITNRSRILINCLVPFVVCFIGYICAVEFFARIPFESWVREVIAIFILSLPLGLTIVITGFVFMALTDDVTPKGALVIPLRVRLATYIVSGLVLRSVWFILVPIGFSRFPELIQMGLMSSFYNIGIVWGVALLAVHLGLLFILERLK